MEFGPRESRLARLFTAVVLGRWDELARLRAAASGTEPDRAWREAVLQAHVFAGFPRVVEAYDVLARAGGLGTPSAEEVLLEPDQPERGRALFERIYREQSDDIRGLLGAGHPDFAAFIEGHAYGRILSRPGLQPALRELLAVAALAALGQERQLASHARGARRCGAGRAAVHATLDSVADLIAPERLEHARRVLARFVDSDGEPD